MEDVSRSLWCDPTASIFFFLAFNGSLHPKASVCLWLTAFVCLCYAVTLSPQCYYDTILWQGWKTPRLAPVTCQTSGNLDIRKLGHCSAVPCLGVAGQKEDNLRYGSKEQPCCIALANLHFNLPYIPVRHWEGCLWRAQGASRSFWLGCPTVGERTVTACLALPFSRCGLPAGHRYIPVFTAPRRC